MATATTSRYKPLLDKYGHHFKHLRILDGIPTLRHELIIDAVTPDGRQVTTAVFSRELDAVEHLLKRLSPKIGAKNG